MLFSAPHSGTFYLAVDGRYNTSANYYGPFTLTLQKYTVTDNSTCAKATALKLTNNTVTVNGTTAAATNEFGTSVNCKESYYTYPGKQLYYKLNMVAGHTYRIHLTPSFYYAVMYVFRSTCTAAAINGDCASNGQTGVEDIYVNADTTATVFYTPSVGGLHRFGVDSRDANSHGAFTLVVEKWKKPANSSCTGAAAIKVPATITSDTTGATNEFGTSINCGDYMTIMRSTQLYYKVSLTAGKTYTFKLSSQYHMARVYIFGGACTSSAINNDCGSGGKTGAVSGNVYSGQTGTLTFQPGKSGTYIVAVDGTYPTYFGGFTLSIN